MAGESGGCEEGIGGATSRGDCSDGPGRDRLAVESARRRRALQSAGRELCLLVDGPGRPLHRAAESDATYPQTLEQPPMSRGAKFYLRRVRWPSRNDVLKIFCTKIFPFVDRVRDYEDVFKDLPELTAKINSVLLPSKYAYSGGVSFAIYETVKSNFVFNWIWS